MKKTLILLPAAALALAFTGCKKEDASGDITSVSSVYKAVVFEYSATWCGPCGQYGYPAMHDLMEEYDHTKHQVTGIFMHPSDDIVDQEPAGQEEMVDYFGFTGTPSGGVNAGIEEYPTYLEPKVRAELAANPTAKAGVGIKATVSGNTVTVNTKTVFFEDATGSYNIAVFVVENNIIERQSGQTGDVEHDYILRGMADGKPFGKPLGGSTTKGTKIDGTYTVTLPAETRNKSNLEVVAVLWKMDASTGEPTAVLNSNSVPVSAQ